MKSTKATQHMEACGPCGLWKPTATQLLRHASENPFTQSLKCVLIRGLGREERESEGRQERTKPSSISCLEEKKGAKFQERNQH